MVQIGTLELPEATFERLSAVARAQNRSVNEEAVTLIEAALEDRAAHKARINATLNRIQTRPTVLLQPDIPTPEEAIRAWRDR